MHFYISRSSVIALTLLFLMTLPVYAKPESNRTDSPGGEVSNPPTVTGPRTK
jgi:hypothetical protein